MSSCAACSKAESDLVRLLSCARCTECQATHWPMHRSECKAPNYLLRISLFPSEIQNPSVTKTLSCPSSATFSGLHEAIQTAFGWAGTYTYDFKIKDPNAEPEPEFDLTTYMARRMAQDSARNSGRAVPDSGPRQNFPRIIEEAPYGPGRPLGGKGVDHMQNQDRVHSQTPEVKSHKIKLGKVFENKEYEEAVIEYEYDFGDCWEHDIEIVGRVLATTKFVCTEGEGHGVLEDIGNIRGWLNLKEAFKVIHPTKDQKEKMKWAKSGASNADPEGLGNGRDRFWDKDDINEMLSH
ncbi:uncharacterized protein LY89DRAFT_740729 [Mollisia scopiformis]|uniref:Plasmid pRiA4b Orf3-like domain-containing protein n=1 Tax=Mollisia scopiformis TaxID=149040 RepID=A0A132BB51_MOLSC|nr:uncharacterized protein LY89DRAFT_740729 [Mollisia scopiformis]KUJ09650.1 hypothetical protein LY89DRAFT_740729 [Mollisia scopiformis]